MKQGKVTFQKIESSYCIREGNIALWFLLIVVGFSALGFADIFSEFQYHEYLPMHSFCECIPFRDNIQPQSYDQLTPAAEEWIETQTLVSFSFDALEILLLAAVLHSIRWLPREFSVMNELAMIMYLRVLQMGCGYLILIVDFRDIFLTNLIYIMVITVFDFLQMLVSAAYILWQSYRPNDIMPFPITEQSISNFDLAIIMPTTVCHFYSFLENLEEYKEALIIFGLH